MKKYNVIRNLEPSTSIFTTEIDCKVALFLPRCCTFLGIAILTFFLPESLLSLYYSCWLSCLSFWLIYSFFRYDGNINEGLLLLFSSLLVCSLDYYHFLKYAEATHHSKCGLGTSSMGVAWKLIQVSSVQLLSHVQLFATPWMVACQASLSITNSLSLLKLISIELVMPSNHLVLCHPLLLLPSIFPSIRVFSNESALRIRWPKYWSFSFNISPSNEYSDWFPLGWSGWISLQSKGLSTVFSNTNSSVLSFLYGPTLTYIHDYWRNHSFD